MPNRNESTIRINRNRTITELRRVDEIPVNELSSQDCIVVVRLDDSTYEYNTTVPVKNTGKELAFAAKKMTDIRDTTLLICECRVESGDSAKIKYFSTAMPVDPNIDMQSPDTLYLIKTMQFRSLMEIISEDDDYLQLLNAFMEHTCSEYSINSSADQDNYVLLFKVMQEMEKSKHAVTILQRVLNETERDRLRKSGYVCETLLNKNDEPVTLVRR